MKRLLVICGVQKDFFELPFGNPGAREILPKIASFVRDWQDDIIVVKETRLTRELVEMGNGTIPDAKPWEDTREAFVWGYAKHCIKWTDGWEIEPEILAELQKKNDRKCTFRTVEAYGQTWHDWANNIATYDQIVICGTKLEDQIISTVFAILAVRPNVNVFVQQNLCCSGWLSDAINVWKVLEGKVNLTFYANLREWKDLTGNEQNDNKT